ncbi:hypothetical protein [Kribbella sp. NPDC051770]|uniref:hypothetical protein n=1 Tax=Kribbella sp. NPDC051770 TaxID=3155413 RepID=UPI00342BE7EA
MMRRRTVLQGALAGSVLAGASVDVAAAAPAAGITPVGPGGARVVHAPDGAAVEVPADLGVELTSTGVPAGAVISLSYDERLYAAAARPVLVRGKQVVALQATQAATGIAHGRRLDLQLPTLAPGTYTVHAGGVAPARYPADLVADPLATEVKVSQGAVTARVLSRPVADQGLPWGVQLGAGWTRASWGDGYYVWRPGLVALHSVGPGVVPAGSRVRVTLDRQVFESVQVTKVLGPDGEQIGGVGRRSTLAGQPTASWTLHAPLAAGARIALSFAAEARSLQGALEYVEPSLVEFIAPKQSRTPQRLTGAESQTRVDDVYSAATQARYAGS